MSIVAGLCLLLEAPVLEAQADTANAAGVTIPRRAVCWRPRPSVRCGGYLVTEFAMERAILATTDDFDVRFVGTVGPMVNRGSSEAWGLLVSVSTDDPDVLGLLRSELRYRKWLGATSGLDLALGATGTRAYNEVGDEVRMRGVTAAAGIDQGLLGVHARVDLLQGGGQSEQAVFAGVKVGGYAGPVAAVVLVVGFFGLMMLAYSGG